MKTRFVAGSSLIDVIVSLAIIAILFAGIYLVYFSLIDSISNVEARRGATSALNARLEIIRNLAYENVGTVGGIPAGVLPQNETVSMGDFSFVITTTVRNIDDPFDGTLGGSPNDTAPADYKQVTLEISCPTCARFAPFTMTTTAAPKNLENTAVTGSLFLTVLDSAGVGVPGASVHIANASVTPAIDLTDTTNASGTLQLVGVATGTQSYQVDVSKNGYSSERTYAIGGGANPNPAKPHATVAAQTVTALSFAIDRTSSLRLITSDLFCSPVAGRSIGVSGAKLIGTSPDVLKFSSTTVTGADGVAILPALEWDTYTLSLSGSGYNIVGTEPFSPLIINPSSSVDFRFALAPAQNPSLMVIAQNAATQSGIKDATVTISRSGFSQSFATGHALISHSDWSGGAYVSQSGGVDTESLPGAIMLSSGAGSYPTSSAQWLVSQTLDLGSSSTTIHAISWSPQSQPGTTGASSVRFQIAANNDNATWNFTGPGGASDTYYTSPSNISGYDDNRYLRYKVFLSTQDQSATPRIDDVSLEFSGGCVPSATALFTGLSSATYTVTVSASGFQTASTSVAVGSGSNQTALSLTP